MKILLVGGAVRDMLLGREFNDIDFLVEGTEEEFLEAFPNAEKTGKAFPVYRVDGYEYAFARREQSNGNGHRDFDIDSDGVSIEEDLQRRDLTINSIAMCPESYELIASDQALEDLENKILRHNNGAFKDDPLRVFRVARFAAILSEEGFTVHPSTISEMFDARLNLKDLSAERVFGEMRKVFEEARYPSVFFDILRQAYCLTPWFVELQHLIGVPAGPDTGKHVGEHDTFHHTMNNLDASCCTNMPIARYVSLCHDLGKSLSPEPPKHAGHDKVGVSLVKTLSNRLRVPKAWKNCAMLFTEEHVRAHKLLEMRPGKAVVLMRKIDRVTGHSRSDFFLPLVADGHNKDDALHVIRAWFDTCKNVKLPEKHRNQGEKSREILTQLQAEYWRKWLSEAEKITIRS